MREDYQTLVDEVTALLGTPATLENRDFALIAFGAHGDEDGGGDGGKNGEDGGGEDADPLLDPVRARSILRRRSTARVRAWFESFGITRAVEPVRIPPDPSAGVLRGRICVPVRHGGVLLGYIWLLDDGALELTDPRLADVRAAADRIGALLAAESRSDARLGRLLRTLLTAAGGHRAVAETELAGELGEVAAGPLAVVAVLPWDGAGRERGVRAGGGIPGAVPGAVAACAVPGAGPRPPGEGLAVLVRLLSPGGLDPARTAAERLLRPPYAGGGGNGDAGRSGRVAGIGAPCTGLAEVPGAWRQALAAARAARAENRLGPVARWDRIGPYRMLTALAAPPGASPGTSAGQPDAAVRALLEPGRRELARTAEVFLDHAGQAGRTAAALGVHRQTLYYRLSRVERLTGLDLGDGEDRLLLHMALKTVRLLES
ncbi:helix-turn-helix domain-containing protein [Streptomyces sp. TRM 70361]|uniref:PucR family transcriptional regulator n=1 Tax=Streptomyces sp. TRM 70361 TaxID=3116553 RepID=UPI002E7B4806|nr:helix-turn-helix domain-containing protein [Streptomyces sp. TRM 70361]MEE1938631.1 helix-turn-helix domain-containing protein [Streptomyces sp. TRM 70361]